MARQKKKKLKTNISYIQEEKKLRRRIQQINIRKKKKHVKRYKIDLRLLLKKKKKLFRFTYHNT